MTSASHAEGRQFDPGQVYFCCSAVAMPMEKKLYTLRLYVAAIFSAKCLQRASLSCQGLFSLAVRAESLNKAALPPFLGLNSAASLEPRLCTVQCAARTLYFTMCCFFTLEPHGQAAGPRSQRLQARVHSCLAGTLHQPQHVRCDGKF